METKHTKGPWYPVQYAGHWVIQNQDLYGNEFDIMDCDNVGEEQAKANATLAAEAPNLLEALVDLYTTIKYAKMQGVGYGKMNVSNKMNKSLNAIKKATP